MSQTAGNWMMGIGGMVTFFGLCLLPAALGDTHDTSSLALSACLFSLGMLTMAGGFYVKARAIPGAAGSRTVKRENSSSGRKVKGGCDACHADDPVILCTVHRVHLCGNCLSQHYDFRSCAYTPSTRRNSARGGKSAAARSGRA